MMLSMNTLPFISTSRDMYCQLISLFQLFYYLGQIRREKEANIFRGV